MSSAVQDEGFSRQVGVQVRMLASACATTSGLLLSNEVTDPDALKGCSTPACLEDLHRGLHLCVAALVFLHRCPPALCSTLHLVNVQGICGLDVFAVSVTGAY